ncbi:MAG TPA: radical SAM protein [Candidatus Stackebrandtia excrementipullorum]|nr:radical SAM protein [Candidatus Stackebrandtia excrementipullorum]
MAEVSERLKLSITPLQRRKPYIYWYLSLKCNLACKHCWVESSPNVDTSKDLSTEDVRAAILNMEELEPGGVLLTGGEPLIHPDITMILDMLAERNIPIHIETNAMFVTDKLVEQCVRIRDAGNVIDFAVSLDGGDAPSHDWCRGKGSFDKTVAGLRRLDAAGLTSDIQCVINRKNWHTLGDLVTLANTMNLQYLKFVLTNPLGRANRFMSKLEIPFSQTHDALHLMADAIENYKGNVIAKVPPAMIPPSLQPRLRNHTTAGGCTVDNVTSCSFPLLGVLPDGSVTICAASRDTEEAYFGDIRELSLSDIWEAQNMEYRRERYVNAELTGICGDCVFKQECRGACRAHALDDNGSMEGPYPVCADMADQGYFPDMYRLSKLEELRERASRLASGAV